VEDEGGVVICAAIEDCLSGVGTEDFRQIPPPPAVTVKGKGGVVEVPSTGLLLNTARANSTAKEEMLARASRPNVE